MYHLVALTLFQSILDSSFVIVTKMKDYWSHGWSRALCKC